jgi:hypothetical protein
MGGQAGNPGDQSPRNPQQPTPADPRQPNRQLSSGQRSPLRPDANQPRDVRPFQGNTDQAQPGEAPITGDGFREWSDRMRDVEEMVNDPKLRAEAAAIRERATALRAEFKRHAQVPNWNTLNESIGQPLAELRDKVAAELLKRDSADARVPIDREPVPAAYAEEVRRYYERLGSGK